MACNNQALSLYSWDKTVKITLKGEDKKDRAPRSSSKSRWQASQNIARSPSAAQQQTGGGLKQRIVEKKKEGYKDHTDIST